MRSGSWGVEEGDGATGGGSQRVGDCGGAAGARVESRQHGGVTALESWEQGPWTVMSGARLGKKYFKKNIFR